MSESEVMKSGDRAAEHSKDPQGDIEKIDRGIPSHSMPIIEDGCDMGMVK